jgi:hypothetical protein
MRSFVEENHDFDIASTTSTRMPVTFVLFQCSSGASQTNSEEHECESSRSSQGAAAAFSYLLQMQILLLLPLAVLPYLLDVAFPMVGARPYLVVDSSLNGRRLPLLADAFPCSSPLLSLSAFHTTKLLNSPSSSACLLS